MSDLPIEKPVPWVCPWGICNTKQAQECRATMGRTKMTRGCGNYFPPGTTLEQAKQMIGPKTGSTAQPQEPGPAGARPSKGFLKGESPQATWPFAQDDKGTAG